MDPLEIVDPHIHLWDLGRNHYPWLAEGKQFRYGSNAPIRRNYFARDYFEAAAPYQVVAAVHVEADWDSRDPVGETRWLSELRADTGFPTVCVGRAFLGRENALDVIAAQASFPFFRGIRDWPTPALSPAEMEIGTPGSMTDPKWRKSYAALERYGLSFDVLAPWWHLGEVAELARDFPNTTIFINHTGYPAPDRNPEALAGWRGLLEKAAGEPNVAIKISGLGVRGQAWSLDANGTVVRDAISIMGVDRCMFASNFPPDSVVGSFQTIFDGFRAIVADMPHEAQRKLFRDNAMRLYRIPTTGVLETMHHEPTMSAS